MEHRLGETGLLPFRTRRVFNIGTNWYFAVRGGSDCGPFENQKDAQSQLEEFLTGFKTAKAH